MTRPPGPGPSRPALQLAPRASEIARVDAWWQATAAEYGAPAEMAEELRVCLHELLGNVVMHAGPAVSVMRVSATNGPEGIALTVEDDGRPFDPTTQPEPPVPASIDAAPIGGLGLVLVRRFADEFAYRRVECRNYVTIKRHITPLSSEAPDSA